MATKQGFYSRVNLYDDLAIPFSVSGFHFHCLQFPTLFCVNVKRINGTCRISFNAISMNYANFLIFFWNKLKHMDDVQNGTIVLLKNIHPVTHLAPQCCVQNL